MAVTIVSIKCTNTFRKIQTSNDTLKFFGKYFLCLFFYENTTHTKGSDVFLYMGIKASRKFGIAVVRNKFKRRIRSLFYSNRNLYNCYESKSLYFVFIPTKLASLSSFAEIQKEYSKMNLFIINRLICTNKNTLK